MTTTKGTIGSMVRRIWLISTLGERGLRPGINFGFLEKNEAYKQMPLEEDHEDDDGTHKQTV